MLPKDTNVDKYFELIEDIVAQADEVDEKYLQVCCNKAVVWHTGRVQALQWCIRSSVLFLAGDLWGLFCPVLGSGLKIRNWKGSHFKANLWEQLRGIKAITC